MVFNLLLEHGHLGVVERLVGPARGDFVDQQFGAVMLDIRLV